MDTGLLSPPTVLPPYVQVTGRSGPRHSVIHPTLGYMFLVSELDSTVSWFELDKASGNITYIRSLSTLPPPYDATGMAAAEIQCSPDGSFIYVSNRDISDPNQYRSSISVYSINPSSGALSYLQTVSSVGIHPRHFDLTEKFMLIANKDSDNIVVMDIHHTGILNEDNLIPDMIFKHEYLKSPTQVLIVDF